MKESDILRKQAAIIDMANENGIEWNKCIKFLTPHGQWRVFAYKPQSLFGLDLKFATSIKDGTAIFED